MMARSREKLLVLLQAVVYGVKKILTVELDKRKK
jgi:hypothetical protein